MDKNKSRAIIWIILGLVVLVLFMLPRWNDKTRPLVGAWEDEGVNCLPGGHQNAQLHIHPVLQVTVDGRNEGVPANVGIVRSCMAEVHTHDVSGTIHIESVNARKTFTLAQFLAVWGKELEREGYELTILVDGLPNEEEGELVLRDKQVILLEYATSNNATSNQ